MHSTRSRVEVPAAIDQNHNNEPGWLKIEIKNGNNDSIIDSTRVRVYL